jgi:hypothetical protein
VPDTLCFADAASFGLNVIVLQLFFALVATHCRVERAAACKHGHCHQREHGQRGRGTSARYLWSRLAVRRTSTGSLSSGRQECQGVVHAQA